MTHHASNDERHSVLVEAEEKEVMPPTLEPSVTVSCAVESPNLPKKDPEVKIFTAKANNLSFLEAGELPQRATTPKTRKQARQQDQNSSLNRASRPVPDLIVNVSETKPIQGAHKRFGSEDPLPDNGVSPEPPSDKSLSTAQKLPSAASNEDSEDEAPEVLQSSVTKREVLPFGGLTKKVRKGAKQSRAVGVDAHNNEDRTSKTLVSPDEPLAEFKQLDGRIVLDSSDSRAGAEVPLNLEDDTAVVPLRIPGMQDKTKHSDSTKFSKHNTKKRKLSPDYSGSKPKDVVRNGITYRRLPSTEPSTHSSHSKQHAVSLLPAKRNLASVRLREQMLAKKRVQHDWSGRDSFLRP